MPGRRIPTLLGPAARGAGPDRVYPPLSMEGIAEDHPAGTGADGGTSHACGHCRTLTGDVLPSLSIPSESDVHTCTHSASGGCTPA